MKTRFAIAAILALFAGGQAWAQSRIEAAIASAEDRYSSSKDEYALSSRSRTTSDKNGSSSTETRVVTFTPKDGDAALRKVLKAFDEDRGAAYYVNEAEGGRRNLVKIGDEMIGSDYDSYYVLCFEDRKDGSMRNAYAVEWDHGGSAFRFTSDHGPRPKTSDYVVRDLDLSSLGPGMRSLADSITRAIDGIDWKAYGDSLSFRLDSLSFRLKDKDWDSVWDSFSAAMDSLSAAMDSMDKAFKGHGRFRSEFGDGPRGYRYHRAPEDAAPEDVAPEGEKPEDEAPDDVAPEHGAPGYHNPEPLWDRGADDLPWASRLRRQIDLAGEADDATPYVSEIYSLCRNCPDSVGKKEREEAASEISGLRSSLKDRTLRKMLAAGAKALK